MNKRLLHATIAGLIGVGAYWAVATIAANNSQLAASFSRCTGGSPTSVDGLACLFIFMIYALYIILAIGLPIAVITAAVYLMLAKFKLLSAILIPLGANALTLGLIVALWQLADVMPPLWAMLVLLVLSHTALGLIRRQPRTAQGAA